MQRLVEDLQAHIDRVTGSHALIAVSRGADTSAGMRDLTAPGGLAAHHMRWR